MSENEANRVMGLLKAETGLVSTAAYPPGGWEVVPARKSQRRQRLGKFYITFETKTGECLLVVSRVAWRPWRLEVEEREVQYHMTMNGLVEAVKAAAVMLVLKRS